MVIVHMLSHTLYPSYHLSAYCAITSCQANRVAVTRPITLELPHQLLTVHYSNAILLEILGMALAVAPDTPFLYTVTLCHCIALYYAAQHGRTASVWPSSTMTISIRSGSMPVRSTELQSLACTQLPNTSFGWRCRWCSTLA